VLVYPEPKVLKGLRARKVPKGPRALMAPRVCKALLVFKAQWVLKVVPALHLSVYQVFKGYRALKD
jgi:hypothetical protein